LTGWITSNYTKAAPTEEPEAALAALKLYEETASAEREARMSLLPVRLTAEYLWRRRLNHFPQGSRLEYATRRAANTLLLPTDPEAIDYPDKTL
jgi:hypothetical protein